MNFGNWRKSLLFGLLILLPWWFGLFADSTMEIVSLVCASAEVLIFHDERDLSPNLQNYLCAFSASGRRRIGSTPPVLYICRRLNDEVTGRKLRFGKQYRFIWVVIFRYQEMACFAQWFCARYCSHFLWGRVVKMDYCVHILRERDRSISAAAGRWS